MRKFYPLLTITGIASAFVILYSLPSYGMLFAASTVAVFAFSVIVSIFIMLFASVEKTFSAIVRGVRRVRGTAPHYIPHR